MSKAYFWKLATLSLLLAAIILKPSVLLGDEVQDLWDKAIECYAEAEGRGRLEEAIKTSKESLNGDNDDKTQASIYVELSKAHFDLGYYHEQKKGKKNKKFFAGKEFAEQAIGIDPTNAGGHYWWALNHGNWCDTKWVPCVSLGFRKNEFVDALGGVIRIDPSYDVCGAKRALASYNIKAPLGDEDMAVKLIEEAVKEAGYHLWNRLIQAEVYKAVGREEDYKAVLQFILDEDLKQFPEDVRPEYECLRSKTGDPQ